MVADVAGDVPRGSSRAAEMRSDMQTTKTKKARRGAAAGKASGAVRDVDIHVQGEDGRTFEIQVPAKTLVKALGWGAAVLIGIEVAKAGVSKLAHRKSQRATKHAAPKRAASRRAKSRRS